MRFNHLSQDLLISILSFIDLPEVIKFLCLSKPCYLKLKDPKFVECLMRQLPSLKLFNLKPPKEDILLFFGLIYKRLYQIQSKPPQTLGWMPLDASSTDKNQSIYCTIPDFNGFWGSTSFSSEDENQWLLFDFGQNYTQCFLKEIIIKFTHFDYVYVNDQIIGNPVFQSKFVQVELGFIPDRPIYKSEVIPVLQSVNRGEELIVTVPISPFIVFARYIRIGFIGLRSRHTLKDNLFYLCVDEIRPRGNYCHSLSKVCLNNAIANCYTKDCKDEETSNGFEDKGLFYIQNENSYVTGLMEKIQVLIKEEKLQEIVVLFEENPQIKTSKVFLECLRRNIEVADLYLETLGKKQIHLNLFETIILLNLSIDWSKLDLFGDQTFQKSDKYLSMFWLYYFVPYKLQKYIHDYYEIGEDEAYENLEEDTVEDVPHLELHRDLELKKILLEKVLEQLKK